MRRARWLLLLLVASRAGAEWSPSEGAELLGTAAPEWRGLTWIQGGPLSLAALRGRPVLIRFWTDGCPYCHATAPALDEIARRYAGRGLAVVGIHHPKSEASRDPAVVARAARELGFTFPVATDPGWATVRAYGVGERFTRYTSVAFLVDGAGVIRWVHDGGEFHAGGGPAHARCDAAHRSLIAAIERALR
jgi:thiol-disulfide isomerase/thioredoxin